MRVRQSRIKLKRLLGLCTRCQRGLIRGTSAEHYHCDPVQTRFSPSEGKRRIELNRPFMVLLG